MLTIIVSSVFEEDGKYYPHVFLDLHMLTIIVSSVFEEDGKYYPHVFLDECLHEA